MGGPFCVIVHRFCCLYASHTAKAKKRNEARLATGIPRMAEPFAGALPDLLIQRALRRSRQRVQACPRHSKKKTPS